MLPAPEVRGALRADVCIVGGGFTGLWTALEIKRIEPSLDVLVVEADVCGTGASGRNGGFAMTFWHHFVGLERACGAAEALRLARASDAAVAEIGEFCDQHGIGAHYRRAGWLWTATNEAQVGAWEGTIAAIERHGEKPFERIGADEVAARSGSPTHIAGVFEPGSATVQPALLVRGHAARCAVARGAGVRALAGCRARASGAARGAHGVRAGYGRTGSGRDGRLDGPAARAATCVRGRLERHRDHRPDPGPAGADRLAERGQHLRFAADGPLLPNDRRRPDRVRPGGRTARLWGADRQLVHGSLTDRGPGRAAPARDLSAAGGRFRSQRAGRGRSTEPWTACRSSSAWVARISCAARATRATASGRA